jgi:hypothetical protein
MLAKYFWKVLMWLIWLILAASVIGTALALFPGCTSKEAVQSDTQEQSDSLINWIDSQIDDLVVPPPDELIVVGEDTIKVLSQNELDNEIKMLDSDLSTDIDNLINDLSGDSTEIVEPFYGRKMREPTDTSRFASGGNSPGGMEVNSILQSHETTPQQEEPVGDILTSLWTGVKDFAIVSVAGVAITSILGLVVGWIKKGRLEEMGRKCGAVISGFARARIGAKYWERFEDVVTLSILSFVKGFKLGSDMDDSLPDDAHINSGGVIKPSNGSTADADILPDDTTSQP